MKFLLLSTLPCAILVFLLPLFSESRMAYQFSSGYELVVGEVQETFSCEDRPYGYYADVDNACMVFHICLPIPDHDGNVSTININF